MVESGEWPFPEGSRISLIISMLHRRRAVAVLHANEILRPPLQHPCSLPHVQPDPWSVLDSLGEDISCFVEIVAGIEEGIDLRAVSRPLLNLVEIAEVRN